MISAAEAKQISGELSGHTVRIGKAFSLCGILATLEDIARPLGPFAAYALIGTLLFLFISVPATRLLPSFREEIKILRWSAVLLGVLSAFLLVVEGANPKIAERGVLANAVPAIAEMQKTFLSMDKHLSAIEANTHQTAESINKLEGSVKKETSADPRKELANRGVLWDIESLSQAEERRDVETTKLLLAGGMRPTTGSHSLLAFIMDRFSEPIAQLYVSYKISDSCPSLDSLLSYLMVFKGILKNEQQTKFIRDLCGAKLKGPAEAELTKLEAEVSSLQSYNAVGAANFDTCIAQLSAKYTLATLDQASHYTSVPKLDPNSPDGLLVSAYNLRLMRGQYPVTANEMGSDIIGACRRANVQKDYSFQQQKLEVLKRLYQRS